MAFTSTDLDAIEAAIASGQLRVDYQDRSVTYRSVGELLRARDLIKKTLVAASTDRLIPRHQVGSFSDA